MVRFAAGGCAAIATALAAGAAASKGVAIPVAAAGIAETCKPGPDGECAAVSQEHLMLQVSSSSAIGLVQSHLASEESRAASSFTRDPSYHDQEDNHAFVGKNATKLRPEEDDENDADDDDDIVSSMDWSDGNSECGSAGRRRRFGRMQSCRRRHSSHGWEDTDPWDSKWKCNEGSNSMVCDLDAGKQHPQPSPQPTPAPAPAPWKQQPQPTPQPPPNTPAPNQPNVPIETDNGRLLGGQEDRGLHIGWPITLNWKAWGLWCQVPKPPDSWNLKECPTPSAGNKLPVKILTYNLYWWNLFQKRGGDGRSAGHLIASNAGSELFDFMAFQECDDRSRILADAKTEHLSGDYETIDGGRALAIAYLASRWTLLEHGSADVGEDNAKQYYGKRSAQWGRFAHRETGKTVFFVNHHGPLPVGYSGDCTGSATSLNILKTIANHAYTQDAIALVGDFNAPSSSSRIQELSNRLERVFSGTAMGGVDHIFSNCPHGATGKNLGSGGSDHDALTVTLKF